MRASVISAVAAAVDYGLVSKRYTPGWEDVLPKKSIVATYGALALGLAAGALLTRRMHEQDDRRAMRSRRAQQRAYGNGLAYRAHDHRAHDGAAKLYALIDDLRICMMTTKDSQGRLFSRPMYALAPDDAGDLWFMTKLSSPKIAELQQEGQVNLAFAHPGKQHYVSVSGRAEVVRDRRLIEERWSEPMRTWFPDGLDDPDITLVRVHPESGEYWDSPSSTVMYLYGYAKAALTGEPPTELADTAQVDLR